MAKALQLTLDLQHRLESIILQAERPNTERTRAKILLSLNTGHTNAEIAEGFNCSPRLVTRVRRWYEQGGLDLVLTAESGQVEPLGAWQKSKILALAHTMPPNGKRRWTISSLANAAVRQQICSGVSDYEVGKLVREAGLKLANVVPTDPLLPAAESLDAWVASWTRSYKLDPADAASLLREKGYALHRKSVLTTSC